MRYTERMAGRASSEESDAFDDVTPAKPVSVDDLDYDGEMPTRAQSSDEIAEFQQKAREKREAAFRSFRPPTERTSSPASGSPASGSSSSPDLMGAPPSGTDSGARKLPPEQGSGSMARPIPRESGPQLISAAMVRKAGPPPSSGLPADEDLERAVQDIAATLQKLPPAPRVPQFEPQRGSLEHIPGITSTPASRQSTPNELPEKRSQLGIAIFALVAMAVFVGLTFFR